MATRHMPTTESAAAFISKRLDTRRHARFLRLFSLSEDGAVLDVSCGSGEFLAAIGSYFPRLALHGADISSDAVAAAKERCPQGLFCTADAAALPYEHARFDAVFSCMSLHHYKEPQQVFAEMSRVLAPGGACYVSDLIPGNRLLQAIHNLDGCPAPYHFEKYYRKKEVLSLAASTGLVLEKTAAIDTLGGVRLLVFRK